MLCSERASTRTSAHPASFFSPDEHIKCGLVYVPRATALVPSLPTDATRRLVLGKLAALPLRSRLPPLEERSCPLLRWISTLDEGGCAPGATPPGAESGARGTVGALGGYGGFFCFALTP